MENKCKWHEDDTPVEDAISCQDCGTLFWTKVCDGCGKTFLDWESKGYDDVCSAPYVTEDGDLVCYRCLKAFERDREDEIENDPDCYDYDYNDFKEINA